jgi:hypothetical protein
MVVGWSCNQQPSGVFALAGGKVRMTFPAPTTFAGAIRVLGVRKGLMTDFTY